MEYIKEQNPEICLAAVKQDSRALEYVKDEFKEEVKKALKEEAEALKKSETKAINLF